MRIQNTSPEEMAAERDEFEALMHAADYRAYELVSPSLPAKLLDFPLNGPVSYAWTGFWDTETGVRGQAAPSITIATSALADVATLRERLGADRPRVRQTPKVATLQVRSTSTEQSFALLDTDRLVAEFDDDGTAVIILARSAQGLPDHVIIQPLTDLHALVEEWKSM